VIYVRIMVTENAVRRGRVGRCSVWCAALLAAAGITVAAGPAATAGAHRPGVPWRQAGPGWSVVEYSGASLSSAHPATARTAFYLVSPVGRKYLFYRARTAASYPQFELVDWSGDRRRILVQTTSATDGQTPVTEQISLATGTVSRIRLPSLVSPDSYTRPDGHSLLAQGQGRLYGIRRYSLSGHLQRLLTTADVISPMDAPNGAFLVVGTETGLGQLSNAGVITRRIRVPAQVSWCDPSRWWTATTVLASCFGRGKYSTARLWLIPLGHGAPTALTPALRVHGLFAGYDAAWRIDHALYLQADNEHDTLSIVRQSADGARRTIHVPGPAGVSDDMLTARNGQLLLESAIGPGGPSSLFWLNPATGKLRFLFRAPAGHYGVAGAIPYDYDGG
jgi:hypothetical protein